MKRLLLIGAGGLHGEYCLDILEAMGEYEIVGICDSKLAIGGQRLGYPVVGRQQQLPELVSRYGIDAIHISLGDNYERYNVYRELLELMPDISFASAIHPTAVIGKGVKLGSAVVIGPGSVIGPGAVIADFATILSGVVLGVGNHVSDFSSISHNVSVGGKVTIGRFSAITLGVTLFDRVTVGENVVVGSGSLVTNSLPDNVLAYGNPAKIIREREPGERFLK